MQKNKRITAETQVIGTNLRFLREAAHLSQYEVARSLGVSYQQIQKYESGQNRFPIEKLFKLRCVYGVPYEYFFKNMREEFEEDGGASKKEIYEKLIDMQNPALKKSIEKIILILLNYEQDSS